jgi:hypothetical protein
MAITVLHTSSRPPRLLPDTRCMVPHIPSMHVAAGIHGVPNTLTFGLQGCIAAGRAPQLLWQVGGIDGQVLRQNEVVVIAPPLQLLAPAVDSSRQQTGL